MKKHIRLASGVIGLGIAMTAGMGSGIAKAESLGGHDAATEIRAGKVAGNATRTAGKSTKIAGKSTKAGGKTSDTALGFTGSAGAKSYRLTATNAVATQRYGHVDEAVLTQGFGFLAKRKEEEKKKEPAGMTTKPYRALIEKHARANGVPVALALAVVRVESNYNPRVRGRAGEIGLMQIKPQTARGIGFTGSASALYDPETNLRWGMKYLAGAYHKAGGDTCGTIMRYQGGHYARRMSKVAVVYCSKVKRHMAGQWA